jgi:hypothetical protein
MLDKKFYFKNYLFYVSITLVCILLISLIIVFDSVFARSIGATITEIKVENPSEIMEAYGKTYYLPLSFAHFYYVNELGLIRTAVHENDINTYNLLNILSFVDFIIIGLVLLIQIAYSIMVMKKMIAHSKNINIVLPIITIISNILLISFISFFSWAYLISFIIVLIVNFLLSFVLYVRKESEKED